MPVATPGQFTIDLNGCARCGAERHESMAFKALRQPMRVDCGQRDFEEFTHWAECPVTGEPIMARMMGVSTR